MLFVGEANARPKGNDPMTQYLILIYGDEAQFAGLSADDSAKLYNDHIAFGAANEKKVAGGNALEATSTATSIRRDAAGEVTVTDGPFAETKEALGGYYLIDAADLDEAIAIAKQVPAPLGGVEVRPIWVLG
jgi:hypothetical protein